MFNIKNLATAFKHPVTEYHLSNFFTGSSQCACGKNLKNVFVVSHPSGDEVHLGSECINNYQELEHVRLALEIKKEKDKALALSQKEEALQAELLVAIKEKNDLYKILSDMKNNREWMEREVFELWRTGYKVGSTQKTTKAKLKALQAWIDMAKATRSEQIAAA